MCARVAGGRATHAGAVGNCALYAVSTAGDALCAEVLEVALYVLELLKACAVYRSVYWKL